MSFDKANLLHRDQVVSNRPPLNAYTFGDLLDMRSQGMSNAEIAQRIKSAPATIYNKIGPQPTNTVLKALRGQYINKLQSLTKAKNEPQEEHHRVTYRKDGVHISADLDNKTIRISPTACNWITISFSQLDSVAAGLSQIATAIQLNEKKESQPK